MAKNHRYFAGMAITTSRYTIAPPSLTPLLHEYGDYDNIPDECWREYIAAHRFWERAWEMYANPKPKRARAEEPPTTAQT
jgi:hypothetical protein